MLGKKHQDMRLAEAALAFAKARAGAFFDRLDGEAGKRAGQDILDLAEGDLLAIADDLAVFRMVFDEFGPGIRIHFLDFDIGFDGLKLAFGDKQFDNHTKWCTPRWMIYMIKGTFPKSHWEEEDEETKKLIKWLRSQLL